MRAADAAARRGFVDRRGADGALLPALAGPPWASLLDMSERSTATVAAILALAAGLLASGCGRGTAEPAEAEPVAAKFTRLAPAADTPARPPVRDDAEADESYATPAGVRLTEKAPAPSAAKAAAQRTATAQATEADRVSPGAPSDAQIARELKQMEAVQRRQAKAGGTAHGATLEADGTVTPAAGVPAVVARVIAGANAIAKFPYVYGGGHGSFVDTAYDCSGSLSYALAAGGLLTATKTSGELARTGAQGPGRWITIYANAGHTFMVIDGVRFDTSGRGGPLGTRWQTAPRSTRGFVVRHPPGL